jgi:hypothetical protein
MKHKGQRKCLCCCELFRADPRNLHHQKYCSKAACRKASKAASQRRWLAKAENRDYFRGQRMSRGCKPGGKLIRSPGTGTGKRSPRYKRTPARRVLK